MYLTEVRIKETNGPIITEPLNCVHWSGRASRWTKSAVGAILFQCKSNMEQADKGMPLTELRTDQTNGSITMEPQNCAHWNGRASRWTKFAVGAVLFRCKSNMEQSDKGMPLTELAGQHQQDAFISHEQLGCVTVAGLAPQCNSKSLKSARNELTWICKVFSVCL